MKVIKCTDEEKRELVEGLCILAQVRPLLNILCTGPMVRIRTVGDMARYPFVVLMTNKDGYIVNVTRQIAMLCEFKMSSDESNILTQYASDISEAVNREFDRRGVGVKFLVERI